MYISEAGWPGKSISESQDMKITINIRRYAKDKNKATDNAIRFISFAELAASEHMIIRSTFLGLDALISSILNCKKAMPTVGNIY